MRRNLRSTSRLPGNIDSYLLENISENMSTEESETGSGSTNAMDLQSLVQGLSGDPTKLCELLVKNLSLANESNQKMQQLLLENQSQPISRQRANFVSKLDECPIKGKYSSLESWLQEVELWDESNKSSEDLDNLNAKKYLKFMSSVNSSEECDEVKKLVQVEFKENKSFNKKSKTIIKDMIKVIKDKLDKTDLEKCSEA